MASKEYTGTNVKFDEGMRGAIQKLVDSGEYDNVSAFVREAVREKLNPTLRQNRMRNELRALLKDPELRGELGLH